MDERLEKALEFANYTQTLNNQLHKAKLRADGMLIYAEAGGKFTITQELICFVDYLQRTGSTSVVLIDDNKIPCRIQDIDLFLKNITGRYFEVTNDYFAEAQKVKKSRSVKSILDIGNT